MKKTAIGRLRVLGWVEGLSYLLLLGVAMPLKYLAGLPLAVKVVGWVHGVLFVLYCVALAQAAHQRRWGLPKVLMLFVSSLVPLGTLWVDGPLRREEEQGSQLPTA